MYNVDVQVFITTRVTSHRNQEARDRRREEGAKSLESDDRVKEGRAVGSEARNEE